MANSATHQATINDLPAEIVGKILRKLPLEDLVRIKITAKRYLEIVSDLRIKRLRVDACKVTNLPIDHCQPNLFLVQFAKSTLSHLQHLMLNGHLQHFDLNELNRFTRLVQLKIGYKLEKLEKVRLNLPELRELEVTCNRKCMMKIGSVKLQKLGYYGDASLLQIEHPETVVTLDTDLPGELLKSFRNVRHLSSSTNLRILSERTLLDLPDLREIAYIGSYDKVFRAFEGDESGEWEGVDDLSPYLERFMERKKALRGLDLKVRFVSFELVNHKPIEDYKFSQFFADYDDRSHGSFNELCLHVHNYDQLIDTFTLINADHRELMQEFRFRLPADFFSKFVGIQTVKCSGVGTEEEHLWFLKSLPQLEKLEILVAPLSESFFRQLSESCSYKLRSLIIYSEELKKLQKLDLPGEFKALDSLEFEMNLSLKEIRWLLSLSWSGKSEFHLKFRYNWTNYGVMRRQNSEEALLYSCKSHHMTTLQTCTLACLSELAEYFGNLPASSEDASWD